MPSHHENPPYTVTICSGESLKPWLLATYPATKKIISAEFKAIQTLL
ncbi:MAG TPA: hypothetical protein VF173_22115 [Thermoanaerobaculia bacterium]|nr:hypothetical protein [Thermoanaerobaculia bacterium]